MKPVIKKSSKKVLQKLVLIWMVLSLISILCFSQTNTYRELKRNYTNNNFSGVLRMYYNMNRYDREYRKNEEEILVMVARAMAERIQSPKDISTASTKIENIFERLLELNHNLTRKDLHLPQKNEKILIDAFQRVYNRLFGKLIIRVNKPDVDIKIYDKYKVTTNKKNDAVELYLWVGPGKQKKYPVVLEYLDGNSKQTQAHWIDVTAGQEKHLNVKIKTRYIEPRNSFVEISLEQNFALFSGGFLGDYEGVTYPFRDISAVKIGVGFSQWYFASIKYSKNLDITVPADRWKNKSKNKYLDFSMNELDILLEVSGKDNWFLSKPFGLRLGYRYLRVLHIDHLKNRLSSYYHRLSGGVLAIFRSYKTKELYVRLYGEFALGISRTGYYENREVRRFPVSSCLSLLVSGEIAYPYNDRFDISAGLSCEILRSLLSEDWASNYFYISYASFGRVILFKLFTRLTFRF